MRGTGPIPNPGESMEPFGRMMYMPGLKSVIVKVVQKVKEVRRLAVFPAVKPLILYTLGPLRIHIG